MSLVHIETNNPVIRVFRKRKADKNARDGSQQHRG